MKQQATAIAATTKTIFKTISESSLQLLMSRTLKAVYPQRSSYKQEYTREQIDNIKNLIAEIQPRDAIEMLLATQIIALHLQGMELIAQQNYHIMGHAHQLFKQAHQALALLQQYRGKSQAINVNYNLNSQGDTVLNTLVNSETITRKDDTP